MSAFEFPKIDRTGDWKGVFDQLDANFSKVAEYLAGIGAQVRIEKFTAEEGQTDFELSEAYNTKNNCLIVYRNDARQWLGTGFTETSKNSFSLIDPCEADDQIIAVYHKYYVLGDQFPLEQITMVSPSGNKFRLWIDDDGTICTSAISEDS